MKALDTNFLTTEAFSTLRAFYIVHRNDMVTCHERGDFEAVTARATKCEGIVDTIMILMGHKIDDKEARDFVEMKLGYA